MFMEEERRKLKAMAKSLRARPRMSWWRGLRRLGKAWLGQGRSQVRDGWIGGRLTKKLATIHPAPSTERIAVIRMPIL
jgi:hypothetical protein